MSFEDWAEGELLALRTGVGLRPPSRNQSFFKYISLQTETSWSHLERTLRDAELVGSTWNSLNDPFELSPKFFDDLEVSWIPKRKFSAGFQDEFEPLPDFTEIKKQAKAYIERVRRYWRIVAFCERSDSPLLWSHYAASYKGACLHFVGRAFSIGAKIGYVKYSNHRPIYPLSLAYQLSDGGTSSGRDTRKVESDFLMFFNKASDWSYETEIRAVYNSNSQKALKFSRSGLVSIVLGPLMDEEARRRVRAMVDNSTQPNLSVRSARLSENSFSVEID
jgi:hypothetical protein